MLKKTIIALLVIGVFVLVGCGTSDVEKADSIEDIVGTWQQVGGTSEEYCQYSDDGTAICAPTLDHIERNVGFISEYWFEGTQYFDRLGEGGGCTQVGVYEISLQPNGNLKFELIEDNCAGRIFGTVGSDGDEGLIEWERVP